MSNKRFRRTLPRKFSDVLILALKDVIIVQQEKKYFLNLDNWCRFKFLDKSQSDELICFVCFAGAVIVTSLNNYPLKVDSKYKVPTDFSENIKYKLFALDALRLGRYTEAFNYFYNKGNKIFLRKNQSSCLLRLNTSFIHLQFRKSDLMIRKKEFFITMNKIVKILQEYNL